MLGPAHVVLRTCQSGRDGPGFEVLLGPQQRKFKLCYLYAAQFMSRFCSSFGVRIGQGVQ
jgi:hypothetical protein